MKLQGLKEEARYRLLVEVATDLNLKRMAEEAEMTKKNENLKESFMKEVGKTTWKETCESFPQYTTDKALHPYLGK